MNDEANANGGAPRQGETQGTRGPIRVDLQALARPRPEAFSQPQKPVDFWVFLDIFAHRWVWLILGSLLFAGAFFYLGQRFIKVKFTASAQLQRIEPLTDFFKPMTISAETFAQLIRSPDLLRKVGAQANPPIPPETLIKCIKIDPDPDSDMVKVLMAMRNPQQAVDLLNTYLKEAVEFTSDFQAQQAGRLANDYLKQQLEEMNHDIDALQREFRGLAVAPELTNAVARVGTNITTLNTNLAMPTQSPALVAMYTERLQKALAELAVLNAKYTPKHPDVQRAQSEVDDLKAHLGTAASNSPSAFLLGLTPLPTRPGETPFNPQLDIARTHLLALEQGRVQLGARQQEAQLYASKPPGMARLFAPANLKTVQSNSRMLKISIATIFGGLMGFGLSLALVMLVELADNRLRTAADVQRVTQLPVLTTLGDLNRMDAHARSQWAFRAWTMLQGRLSPSANHGLVCGITSCLPGEGRTTWINLLAEAASLTGFRVLTIATKPSPVATNHSEPEHAAEDAMPMPDAAPSETPDPSHFTESTESNKETALAPNVLASPAEVTEQLNSQPVVHIPLPGWVWNLERRKQWRQALNQWRKIDNLVILVELPPASVTESVLLGCNLPNLVWLTEAGSPHAGETRAQLSTLRHARCNLVGAVLNRESARSVKSRFPRWLGCIVALSILALGNAHAQNTNAVDQSRLISALESVRGPSTSPRDPTDSEAESPAARPQFQSVGSIRQLAAAQPVPGTGTRTEVAATAQPPEDGTLFAESAPVPGTNGSFSIVRPAQRAAWQQHLTLGAGDVINIGLFGQPELTRTEVVIAPDGHVDFLQADVLAAGSTIDELREKLDKALSEWYRAPHTIITPVAFRSKKYYVLGKVMTKGVYVLDHPMTLVEAIARAHGLENGLIDRNLVDLADYQRSFLVREGKRYPLNFDNLFHRGDLSQNIAIEPDDYLYLATTAIKEVYVVGEVRLPGTVVYTPALTVMGAISARGGYTDRAFKARVLVVRGSLDNPEKFVVNTHAILDAKQRDFQLRGGDIVFVNSRPFIKVEELADLAITAFIQSFVTSWTTKDVLKPYH